MSKRPHIPQTRSSQYRPMTQMNGDFLSQLKKPVCSELNSDVSSTYSCVTSRCLFFLNCRCAIIRTQKYIFANEIFNVVLQLDRDNEQNTQIVWF